MSAAYDIKNSLAILIISCDKYSDLWKPFFALFLRYWPDCPFRIYFLSNKIPCGVDGVENILVGEDISWSDNIRAALGRLREEYVLLFLDDLFLNKPVNTQRILNIVTWALQSDVNYVRLNPMKNGPDKPFNEYVGVLSKGAIYRASTVMAVWRKSVLMDLLKEGESAWDFEIYGSERSDKYDNFYAVWEECFAITNAVIKGKWHRGTAKKLKMLCAEIDLGSRQMMTLGEMAFYCLLKLRSHMLSLLPAKHRRAIKSFFLGGEKKS
jgi:hypothetical protein